MMVNSGKRRRMSIGGEIMSGDKVIVSDSMVDGRDGSKIRTNDPA